ncbi:MAG: protein translocase subunit SecD [Anaerohalosphaeraceae bacterium]|nr:protein translocase subunit SecD [Anaerohalosphaeraceae bacterium]
MDRNIVRFGLIAMAVLVLFAAFQLYPPNKTLKPGLDLAGGTSLVYEIDSTGLESREITNLAQRLIPILRKRIDPDNIQNIVMRPHGDTRIEIQVPLASADTHLKRAAYDEAMAALEQGNINLAVIKRSLAKDTTVRAVEFAEFAADSNDRSTILEKLAKAYDNLKVVQAERDLTKAKLDTIAEYFEEFQVLQSSLQQIAMDSIKTDPNSQMKGIEFVAGLTSDPEKAKEKIFEYIEIYKTWSKAVNELTDPQTGLNALYRDAENGLKNFNLSSDALAGILEMPESSIKRAEIVSGYKAAFPERSENIDNLVTIFKDYRSVRGRIDGPEDVKRMLKGAGVLEFRILPRLDDGQTNRDEILPYSDALKIKGPKLASDDKYIWMEIEDFEGGSWRPSERNQIVVGAFADKFYVLTSNQKGQCLLKHTGSKPWKLQKARPSADDMGKRAIAFTFDEIGGKLFYSLTRDNLQRPLCIVLDGQAISAPNISSAIRTSGIITGSFSMIDQIDMVDKLNAGSLPARLIEPPLSEKTMGATIGADNRDKGVIAGFVGMGVVAAFMLVYYMRAGLIADMALFMNILFILGMMALSRATFTLPGIAGIILTIGMSVDANVLIFERIREEQLRGSSLRIAIENGYQRAFSTILDANITTFITALILYMVASEEIKGFALTLMLGIASSMFTALFATRVVFQWLLDKGIIKDHLMMLRLVKKPNINWMKLRHAMFGFSMLMIAGGLFVFFSRDEAKNSKYDIEFTGGTSVQINLKAENPLERTEIESLIRNKGKELNNPAIASANVYSVGEKDSKTQYEITTTETNKATVEITLSEPNQTAETIIAGIEKAQKTKRGRLTNLIVTADSANPAKFIVATSQVNKSVISSILQNAFGPTARITEPVVDEIVSRAVKEAFQGKLEIMENLKPKIVSAEKIDETILVKMPELSDFFGGVKIEFTVEQSATIENIGKRLKDLQFKPDMQDILWHQYKLYDKNLNEARGDVKLTSFIYVSAEPEAGYRDLSANEWSNFVDNETSKITSAATMQTSLPRVTQIAPSIGKQAKQRAIAAIILSLLAIIAYIWVRFGTARYGVAAIVALVHDVCITLGVVTGCTYLAGTSFGQAIGIGDFKIDLAMIAAFLTIIGYSLNDTIVVFDRIRENKGRLAAINPQILTDSINQTLSRTLLTSFTTFMVVLVMYIYGGAGLRGFTFAMLVGIVVGTYSSIAIAAPILIIGKKTKAASQK